MNQSYPGGPGDRYQPNPGRGGQPDQRPDDDWPDRRPDDDWPDQRPNDNWFRPQHGQQRDPGTRDVAIRRPDPRDMAISRSDPRDVATGRRHGDVDLPRFVPRFDPRLRATSVDLAATVLDRTVLKVGKPGRTWALILGTVFFLVDTLFMAEGFARPIAIGSRVLVIFIWLVSVAAAALLWLRSSPKFASLLKQISLAQVIRPRAGSHSRKRGAIAR